MYLNEKTIIKSNIRILKEISSIITSYYIARSFNIKIQYFKQNPVRKLYERLGFIPNWENNYHYQMIK